MTSSDVLLSVFPVHQAFLGSTAPRDVTGEPLDFAPAQKSSQASRDTTDDQQGWSIATTHLAGCWAGNNAGSTKVPASSAVAAAIQKLASDYMASSDESRDLTAWYRSEARSHFMRTVAPTSIALWSKSPRCEDARRVLLETCLRLKQSQDLYLRTASDLLTPYWFDRRQDADAYIHTLTAQLHSMHLQVLPLGRYSDCLSFVIFEYAKRIFRLSDIRTSDTDPPLPSRGTNSQEFLTLLEDLQSVGLGGRLAQEALASAMDELMRVFVQSRWADVDWHHQQSITPRVHEWVRNGLQPFVQNVLSIITEPQNADISMPVIFSDTEITQWVQKAIRSLGLARVDHLFDYILRWPDSMGSILDLKEYTTTPAARAHLTTCFIDQLRRRLLHAGATTTQILDIYISIIRSFTELDAKGVLLDRVARPIRKYLKARDDTAKLIVASLLADVNDVGGSDPHQELSVEIAKEMEKPVVNTQAHQGDFDWDNMNWTPNPIDADPDFKAKSEDILASLLSLFDREDFINELKTILGDHLLRNLEATDYDRETKLLELFKHRLGDDKLQACEVMLNDVQTSKRMTAAIIRCEPYQQVAQNMAIERNESAPILDTQVLSSYFWPSLRDETFKVPPPVQALYDEYGRGFEKLKDMRKLQWLSALGRVDVVLELQDRTIEESVPTWVASVIYAFSSDNAEDMISHTAEQLEEALEMDEDLVRNGILYWIGKQVLHEATPGTYSVLERLPNLDSVTEAENAATAAAAAAQAEADAAASAVKTQEDVFNENLPLYEQFVLGMLTNQGNLPSMRIWMMLKMVFPGGFTFGLEEVQGLLQKMAADGVLVGQGDIYGIKK